jgi:hypothetical protein
MSFSTAELAVVAYALVKADGTSGEINSGVSTIRLSAGIFNVILPGSENMVLTEPLQQGQGDPKTGPRKDLILVTVYGDNPVGFSTVDIDEYTKQILFNGGTDTDFAIVILRPTIPTPTGSSGAQNGPT